MQSFAPGVFATSSMELMDVVWPSTTSAAAEEAV
jgi:hypothetical protein